MTKTQKILAFGSVLGSTLLSIPGRVLAATTDNIDIVGTGATQIALNNIRVGNIINTLVTFLLGIAGIVSFIFLLWGGLQWIFSGGDKEGTEKARKRITAALIGLAIVFSAYALIWILGTVFGVGNLTTVNIPTIPI